MISAAAFAFALFAPSKPPKWLDRMLAGYALEYDETHNALAVYDPKTGFYLIRDVECDGGDLSVLLTRDRNLVTGAGYKVPGFKSEYEGEQKLTVKSLPSLSTGKGVRIGDTPATVQGRLGKARKVQHSGSRRQYLDFIYTWSDGGANGDSYTERYTFKSGKLIEIAFAREVGSGG